jgi:hypothetical protein
MQNVLRKCNSMMQIKAAIKRADAAEAHAALADMIYMEGLPMTLTKSKYLKRFITAVQKLDTYKPPSYATMRTTLLDQAVERVDRQMEPWDDRISTTGCTLCSDGWSDAVNRPLLNMLAVNPKGSKFITAVSTSGETKSADYIASRILESIEAVGSEHVVQVMLLLGFTMICCPKDGLFEGTCTYFLDVCRLLQTVLQAVLQLAVLWKTTTPTSLGLHVQHTMCHTYAIWHWKTSLV